jgi:hypothetical protein
VRETEWVRASVSVRPFTMICIFCNSFVLHTQLLSCLLRPDLAVAARALRVESVEREMDVGTREGDATRKRAMLPCPHAGLFGPDFDAQLTHTRPCRPRADCASRGVGQDSNCRHCRVG